MKQNGWGIAGFVLSFFTGPIAFIFSLIGLIQGKRRGDRVGLAIAGLVISSLSLIAMIISYATILPTIMEQLGQMTSLALL